MVRRSMNLDWYSAMTKLKALVLFCIAYVRLVPADFEKQPPLARQLPT